MASDMEVVRNAAWQFNEAVSLLREARTYVAEATGCAADIDEGLPAIQEALVALAALMADSGAAAGATTAQNESNRTQATAAVEPTPSGGSGSDSGSQGASDRPMGPSTAWSGEGQPSQRTSGAPDIAAGATTPEDTPCPCCTGRTTGDFHHLCEDCSLTALGYASCGHAELAGATTVAPHPHPFVPGIDIDDPDNPSADWCNTCGERVAPAVAPPAPTGAELIAAERRRQVETEGWTPEHDAEHTEGDLIEAAIAYAVQAAPTPLAPEGWPWPWHADYWKPTADPARNLIKAGALIAAELDRLLAAGSSLAGVRSEAGEGANQPSDSTDTPNPAPNPEDAGTPQEDDR